MMYLKCGVLAAGGFFIALSVSESAWAQCELEGDDLIVCGPGDYGQIAYNAQTDVELRLDGDISTDKGIRLTGQGDLAITGPSDATLTLDQGALVAVQVVNHSSGLTLVDLGNFALGNFQIGESGGDAVDVRSQGDIDIRIGHILGGDGAGGIRASSTDGGVRIEARDISILAESGSNDAINASSGAGRIEIAVDQAISNGEGASAVVASSISGDISITAGSAFSYEGNAVRAVSETGDISVILRTASSSGSAPIYISTAGTVSLNVEAGGTVSPGDIGTPASHIAGDAGVNILIQGALRGDDDNPTPLYVSRGFLGLRNEGVIVGMIGAADGIRFENVGVWRPIGEMTFLGDDDVMINSGVIQPLHTDPGCCFDPARISLTGLETFRNAGLIDLRGGGSTDNRFVALDTTYVGEAGASFAVDFNLGDGAADHLSFGAIQGQTTLTLNLLGEGAGFAPATTVVSSTAAASPDAVVLDPDSATSGFTQVALDYDADARAFTLQALPSDAALANLRLGWAAQDYAAKSGESWSGRLEDLRDSIWAGTGRSGGVEAWGQAVVGGREQEQVSDFYLLGTTIRRDISTETDWRGIQYGMDRAFGPVLLGVTGGFLDYDMAARTRPDRFALRGFNLGAYAAYLNGPFSLSGLAKVDRFESRAVLRSVDGFSEIDGTAWDAQVEAAWRFGGRSLFVEPVVSADFIRADLDDLSIAGAIASYSHLDSLKVKAGVHAGGRVDHGALILTPSIGLYVTDERLGENVMDFAFGTSTFSVTDHPYDAHGRADVGLGVVGPHGLAAYVKGEFDFGDGAEGATLRLGARWSW